ncbi:hypothetical protein ABVK25_005194 [Lepraria finkii]|uniref:Thioesterase domain-containing protein n=1 Tax=Lepraria finkii TaxID=1340010 RepID=A0ABR4B9A8_9LECA
MESLFHIQGNLDSELAPLFLIHAVSGFALPYLALGPLTSDHPSRSRPVYGLSCPTYESKSYKIPLSFEKVAREYVDRIRVERPHGPYMLGGWSMGGMIAVKMASILQEQGQEVVHVVLIDSTNPQGCPWFVDEDERSAIAEYTYEAYSKRTGLPGLEDMADEEDDDFNDSDYYSDSEDEDDDVDIMEYLPRMRKHIINSWDMITRAGQGYYLGEGLTSPVTLVKCTDLAAPPPGVSQKRKRAIQQVFNDDRAGWKMEQFETILMDAQHDDVFDGAHISTMTQILRGILAGVTR